MSNYFLEHYGVAGMKWGRRRTPSLGAPVIELGPNEYRDSSRTTGNGRTNTSNSNGSTRSNTNSNTRTTGNNTNSNTQNSSTNNNNKDKFNIKGVQDGLKDGKKLTEAGTKYLENDRKKRNVNQLKSEAKNMSDDDLKTIINRLSMEDKYVSVMEKQGVAESKTNLQTTLETIGTVVSYADTALSVYKTIEEMRRR